MPIGPSEIVLICVLLISLCLCTCSADGDEDPSAPLTETFTDSSAALERWEYTADGPAHLTLETVTRADGTPGHEVYVDFRERATWSLLSRQALELVGGGQYTLSAQVRCNLGYGRFELVARTDAPEAVTLASVTIVKRANEPHTLTAVFRAPKEGARVRVGFSCSGYSEIRIARIGLKRNVPPLSSYQTGLLLASTPLIRARYRTGAMLEAGDMLEAASPVTGKDEDGNGMWALCAVDPDDNPWLFSENTVVKSDSLSREEGGSLPALRVTARNLMPGLYQAYLSDPMRDAAYSLDGENWQRATGGAGEVQLGLVRVDGPFSVWVDHRYLTEGNPGPVYVDYLRFMPVYEPDVRSEEPVGRPPALTRVRVTELPLTLHNRGGHGRAREWVTAGAPFEPGAFLPGDGVEVGGVECLEAQPLVHWPDGSVKWLRLRFRADLPGEPSTVLPLRFGPGVAEPATIACPLERAAEAHLLRAGGLEVEIRQGIWDRIALNGRTIVSRPPSARITTGSGVSLTRLVVDSATLERGGGQPALRISGHLAEDGVPGRFRFTARLCERAPETLGISFGVVNETDDRFEPERGCSPATELIELSLVIDGVQVSPQSVNWPCGAQSSEGPGQRLLQTGTGRCVEDFAGEWTLCAGERLLAQGQTTEGWVDLTDGEAGLAVGVREFMEKQPGSLCVRPAGEGMQVEVGLWPRREGQSLRWAQGTELATQIALVAHDGRLAPADRASRLASVLQPVQASLPPGYYCDTGVFGPLTPEREARFEPFFKARDAFLQALKTRHRSYGIEDWGDFFADNGYVRGSGKLWTNMEWEYLGCLIQQFATTGDSEYLAVADEAARHFASIDTVHYSSRPEWLGGSYVHTGDLREGHQVDPPDFAHAGWTQGLLWVYYLCGGDGLVDAATGIADYVVRNMPPQGEYKAQPPFSMWNCSRQAGNPILTLASVWELSRDPEHYATLSRLVDFALRAQDPKLGCWSTPFYEEPVHHRPSPDYAGLLFRGLHATWQLGGDGRIQRSFGRLEDFLLCRHPEETRKYLRPGNYYRQTLTNIGVPCALSALFSEDPGSLATIAAAELVREFPPGPTRSLEVRGAPGVLSSGALVIGAAARPDARD